MSSSEALLPQLTAARGSKVRDSIFAVIAGSIFLAACAQISIPLPWTPVPVTGQTFAAIFLGLVFGARYAALSFLLYTLEGFVGLPVFAQGKSFILGPTSGYIFGMLIAAYVVGTLSDRGFTKSWVGSLAASVLGMCCVYACGLAVLSYFVPRPSLFAMGLVPFLAGDTVKIILAASAHKALRLSAKA